MADGDGGLWWLFASNFRNVTVSHSVDGIRWQMVRRQSVPFAPNCNIFGNRAVWIEVKEWAEFHLLQEQACQGGVWQIYHYTSSDGLSDWMLSSASPVQGLQRAPGGMVGGPSVPVLPQFLGPRFGLPVPTVFNTSGVRHVWFHAAAQAGNLPTDVYHAVVAGSVEEPWTVLHVDPQTNPLGAELEHRGAYLPPNSTTWEYDQAADPSFTYYMQDFAREDRAPSSFRALMFWDGDNNNKGTCSIGMAVGLASETFPGFPSWGTREVQV